uniref:Uncharacterized protein n=1 Tax=Ixodes ricinus TaxID=34613 RepID=A0A6B0TXR2_IXORI
MHTRLYLASTILCYVGKASIASSVLQLCQLVARVNANEMQGEASTTCSRSNVWLEHRERYASLDKVARNS